MSGWQTTSERNPDHPTYVLGDEDGSVQIVCACGWHWYSWFGVPPRGVASVDVLVDAYNAHLPTPVDPLDVPPRLSPPPARSQ